MTVAIRDASLTDMETLQGVFQRASLSNENDRAHLLEHPQWLVVGDRGAVEGRMRVAVGEDGTVLGFAPYLIVHGWPNSRTSSWTRPLCGAASDGPWSWTRQHA